MSYLEQPSFGVDTEAVFVFDNRGLTSNGTTYQTDYAASNGSVAEVNNLGSSAFDLPFRTGSLSALPATTTTVSVFATLGEPTAVNWVSMHRHNVRVPWRVSFHRSDPIIYNAAVWQSAWIDPVIRAALADFDYRDLRWTLGPSARRLDELTNRYRLDSLIKSPQVEYAITHVRIDFDVSEEKQLLQLHDYLQIGGLMISRAFQPNVNVIIGFEYSVNDPSQVVTSIGGAKGGRSRERLRQVAFSLDILDRTEAFESVFAEYAVDYGKLGKIFCWLEPDHPRYFYSNAFVGTAASLPKSIMLALNRPGARGWVIEETL